MVIWKNNHNRLWLFSVGLLLKLTITGYCYFSPITQPVMVIFNNNPTENNHNSYGYLSVGLLLKITISEK